MYYGKHVHEHPIEVLFVESKQIAKAKLHLIVRRKKQVMMYCSKRQFVFDVHDIHVLKLLAYGLKFLDVFMLKCPLLRNLVKQH